MKKKVIWVISFLIAYFVIRLWSVVYHHDEFTETYFFIKHRPILKWEFYSPIGMSDIQNKEISKEQRADQILFEEFISSKGLSK